ncbi:MAG: hypothetical protein IJ412_04495 [Oscillospiraceae bacterium]|nr:hypothetical protein [Oscillospiraceae bacterium]
MENALSCKSITPQQDAAEAAPQDRDDDFLKQTAVMVVFLSGKNLLGIIYLFWSNVNSLNTKILHCIRETDSLHWKAKVTSAGRNQLYKKKNREKTCAKRAGRV